MLKPTSLGLALVLWTAGSASAEVRAASSADAFQAALQAAVPGDVIELPAGAVLSGNFVFPAKPDGPAITIRSSATLPDRRIGPADDALLAGLRSPNVDPVLDIQDTANWRLEGLRLYPTAGGEYNVVRVMRARNISFDRILFLGEEPHGQRRVILGNGRQISLARSYFANVFRRGDESNAFCAYDGAGPYTLTDNYFEVAGINILFGGAASTTAADAPADILVERNHLTKRLEWRPGQPAHATVKNLFEVKHGKRITVRDNLLERNWTDAQNGFAVLFSTSDDAAINPWTVIEHVRFERNIVRDTERGINISGHDGWGFGSCSQTSNDFVFRHNLIQGGFQIGSEHDSVTFDHNTFYGGGLGVLYKGGVSQCNNEVKLREAAYAVRAFVFTNNLGFADLFGDVVGIGSAALSLTLEPVWERNVVAGAIGWMYPEGTLVPSVDEHQAQFHADWSLVEGSVYRGAATDGSDLGAMLSLPPSPEPEPEPTPDPDLEQRIVALEAALAAARAELGAANDLIALILAHLQQTPSGGNVAALRSYLRSIGK